MELISPYPPHAVKRPVMLQTWRSLTFLHWRYEPTLIRRLLPPSLQLDTFDGAAWVGLVPFLVVNLKPPKLPAFPWISHFPETNVRTYVRGPDGKRGVWFFTLDADRLAAVLGARTSYHLPYRWARMQVKEEEGVVTYASERLWPFGKGQTRIAIQAAERMESGQFDNFLTARFCLYSYAGKKTFKADIEHHPWPLQRARVLQLDQNLIERSGVPKAVGEPVVHFSESLDVRVARLRRLD